MGHKTELSWASVFPFAKQKAGLYFVTVSHEHNEVKSCGEHKGLVSLIPNLMNTSYYYC